MAKRTFLEVQKQIEQLQREAEQLRKAEASEVLRRIKEAISVYGFTAAELGVDATAVKRAAKPVTSRSNQGAGGNGKAVGSVKFRDQNGNKWSGRGPRPAWFKAALEAGKSPDDLLVS